MGFLIVNGKFNVLKIKKTCFGFTLIELLVVMAVLAILLTTALPKYFKGVEKAKEAALQHDLSVFRESIDKYYGDKGKYPMKLEDLVSNQYLKKIPLDPITERYDSWVVIQPSDLKKGNVYDIKSGSDLTSSNGKPYSDW